MATRAHGLFNARSPIFLVGVSTQGAASLRLSTEMELAASMHRHLVPPIGVRHGAIIVEGRSIASGAMGGDLVDAAVLDDGRVEVVVADVAGHGVRAGVIMAMVKAVLHAHRANPADGAGLATMLEALNAAIERLTDHGDFVTLAAVRIGSDGSLECVIAGHPPVFIRRADGTVAQIAEGGMPIGIVPNELLGDAGWHSVRAALSPGDRLVLYTDGLVEIPADASGPTGEQLGVDGLEVLVARCDSTDPGEMLAELLGRTGELAMSGNADDDRSAVVVGLDRAESHA